MDWELIQADRELANSGLKTARIWLGQVDVDPVGTLIS